MNIVTTIFVLVLWVDGYRAGGLITQEFTSKEKCETALTLSKQHIESSWSSVYGVCVEK